MIRRAAAAVSAIVIASALFGCTRATTQAEQQVGGSVVESSTTATVIASRPETPTRQDMRLGMFGTALDNGSGRTDLSVEAALAMAPSGVALPDPALCGSALEVFVDEAAPVEARSLGIRFERGFQFYAEPAPRGAQRDWRAELASRKSSDFVDGRAKPYEVQVIAGRDTVVQYGGMTTYGTDLEPRVTFYLRETLYTFVSDTAPIELLIEAAGSVK